MRMRITVNQLRRIIKEEVEKERDTRFEAALKLVNDKLGVDACEHVRGGEIIMYVPDQANGGVDKVYLSPADLFELADAFTTIAASMNQVQRPPER